MATIDEIDASPWPVLQTPASDGDERAAGPPLRTIDVAFVNNMSEAALASTERQFARLLTAAAGEDTIRWQRYRLVPLGGGHYGDLADLRRTQPDLVVVTGAEPTRANLPDEPFWRPLAQLLEWADRQGIPVLLSCLAAHAAVLHFDGIRRVPLTRKRFGVFAHARATCHELTADHAAEIRVAHSRWNEVSGEALAASGYLILTCSPEAGVDMFVKQRGALFLHCQGHPEYEPETLLREYRRDICRYLRGEREVFPEAPAGCLDRVALQAATEFRGRAEAERDERLAAALPYALLADRLDRAWGLAAAAIIGRWLRHATAARHRLP